MKNFILTFVFFFTINLCCVGQIDSHVLEFNVGKTTKKEVVRILQQKYYSPDATNMFDDGESINVFKSIKLWGCEWRIITFDFRKGILYQIHFSYWDKNTLHILNLFDTVLSKLNNVYGRYNITKNPQSLFQQLRDDTFSINLSTLSIDGMDSLDLTFTDLILYNQIP